MEKPATLPAAPAGLLDGAATLFRHLAGLLVARLELAALELSEVRQHVFDLLLLFALTMVCTLLALACGAAVVVALAWERMGWTILLLLFAVFGLAALLLARKGRAMLGEGRLALPETMNEFRQDRDLLL